MQKENEEKAAKARAEKELAAKQAKEKADQERIERLKKQQEIEEKAAKARAEKELAAKQAKEKADRDRIERLNKQKEAKEKAAKVSAEKQLAAKQSKEKADQEQLRKQQEKISKEPTKKDASKEKDGKDEKSAKKRESANDDNILDGSSSSGKGDESIADLLDEDAEKPQIEQRLARDRDAYRPKAEAACKGTMRAIDACYARTNCRRPAETPTVEQCNSIPAYPRRFDFHLTLNVEPKPGDVCYHEDDECRAVRAANEAENQRKEQQDAEELASQQNEWTSRYSAISKECAQRKKERDGFVGCQKQYGATCNPRGLSGQAACVEHMMDTSGPTANSARAKLKKEWDEKSRTDKKSSSGKKHDEPHNYLD